MPSYVVLINWTEQGVKSANQTLDRAEHAESMISSMGGSIKSLYWTSGRHDIVAIIEAPDDTTMSAAALKLASQGAIRTETLRAFDRDEMKQIIEKMG
jgi:uncharacterized protein with GYD domain